MWLMLNYNTSVILIEKKTTLESVLGQKMYDNINSITTISLYFNQNV